MMWTCPLWPLPESLRDKRKPIWALTHTSTLRDLVRAAYRFLEDNEITSVWSSGKWWSGIGKEKVEL